MRKIRSDTKQMAKCGLTSRSRCVYRKANLEECKTCTLVKRWTDKWKMVDRKPVRQCCKCKEFKPLGAFYPKKVVHGDKVYACLECICKECRHQQYVERKRNKDKGNRKAV